MAGILTRSKSTAALLSMLAATPVAAAPGSWSPVGPAAGWVSSLAVVYGPSGRLLAATANAGVFRSDDAAGSWTPSNAGLVDTDVMDVEADPADATIVYAGSGAGLFKSTDAGESWLPTGLSGAVDRVAVAASAHRRLYAAVASGDRHFWRSDDGGASWREIDGGLPTAFSVVALQIDPTDADTVYLALLSGLFKSRDGGMHWADQHATPPGVVIDDFALDPGHPSTLYLAAAGGVAAAERGFFKSGDGGVTWSPLAITGPLDIATLLAVAPSAPGTVYAGFVHFLPEQTAYTFLLRASRDGGSTWSEEQVPEEMRRLIVDPHRPSRAYAASLTGVLRRRPAAASWVRAQSGLRAAAVTVVACDQRTPGTLYAAARIGTEIQIELGLYRSTDAGATWAPSLQSIVDGVHGPYVANLTPDPVHAGTVYAMADGVLKSTDGGVSWSAQPMTGLITDLAVEPRHARMLLAAGGSFGPPCSGIGCPTNPPQPRAYQSDDAGASWRDITSRLLPPTTTGVFNVVKIDPVHPRFIYIGGDQTFKSRDRGLTWTPLPVGSGIVDLALDPAAPRILYAATGADGRVLKSGDGGGSWSAASAGLPTGGLATVRLAVDPATSTVYLATNRGVFVSRDRATSWQALDRGLLDLSVHTVAVDPLHPGTVYAGTDAGLFTYSSP